MAQHLPGFWRRNGPVLRTWAIFALSIGGMVSLLALPPLTHFFDVDLAAFIARLVGPIFGLLGTPVAVSGNNLSSGRFAAQIIAACTPVLPSILYLAAILAFPSRLKAKLWGAVLGLPVLFAINLVRIVNLFYIGSYFPQYLEVAHYLVWQGLIILAAVALWLVWLEVVTPRYEHA